MHWKSACVVLCIFLTLGLDVYANEPDTSTKLQLYECDPYPESVADKYYQLVKPWSEKHLYHYDPFRKACWLGHEKFLLIAEVYSPLVDGLYFFDFSKKLPEDEYKINEMRLAGTVIDGLENILIDKSNTPWAFVSSGLYRHQEGMQKISYVLIKLDFPEIPVNFQSIKIYETHYPAKGEWNGCFEGDDDPRLTTSPITQDINNDGYLDIVFNTQVFDCKTQKSRAFRDIFLATENGFEKGN